MQLAIALLVGFTSLREIHGIVVEAIRAVDGFPNR